jgi:uncharacterized membrane-anchored protein YhcB (DUF1043 family)
MRIVLAVVLVGVLIGLIVFKTGRDQSKIDEAFRQGVAKAQTEVAAYQKRAESLRVTTDQTRLAWADSLRRHDSVFTAYRDSVQELLSSQADQIKQLQKKTRSAVKSTAGGSTASATKSKTATGSTSNKHLEILTYYKNRYQSLPGDLSVYERKAALSEIRHETVTKFAISAAELDQIRKANKLEY